ncbi:MAG: ATP-binding protein [Cytophagaceae bacterium]|jgi:molecular chaperone HtpG|nr:ATP-binding protein [Cytophagaceae bacterium]
MNTTKFIPIIGKNVIENLTVGMYDDPRFVYREYVQNAADQIDIAKRENLYQHGDEPSIYIQIDADSKKIVIEDNATGIKRREFLSLLGNIAQSTKNKYEDKGFRGIGRLGGLGYCEKLIFETSFYGEDRKSIMTWDAKMLKKIFNDESVTIDAAALISIITDYSFENPENPDAHYFKVTMENVTNENLLDVQQVRDYLSMVAPVPFANIFTHRNKIYQTASKKNIIIDEYNVYVNTDQLFKGYKDYIYKNNAIEDAIIDVAFFEEYYNEELLFWGWFGISKNMHQIPDENKSRGIRLRKSNIQIGLENRLDEFHYKEQGNRYFIGEVYAINKELIPNGRRDFFLDGTECMQFSKKLRELFHKKLYSLYYDFSKKNTATETMRKFDDLSEKLKDKYINQEEKKKTLNELKSIEKKVVDAKKILPKLAKKYNGQVLGSIIKESGFDFEKEQQRKEQQEERGKNTGIDAQRIIDNKKELSQEEEFLLKKVYVIIRQNPQMHGEELVQKIDGEVRK